MSESATPETGALTVDQAVSALLPQEPAETVEDNALEAPAGAEEPQEPQGEDQSPEETEAEPEEPAEGEETEAEAEPVEAHEPPKYWSKDAKDAFAKLPPDLQAVVLAQEGPREEAAAKAKAEAARISDAAKAEMAKVQTLASELATFLPQALQTFQSRWGDQAPDWMAYAQENGVEAMTIAKTKYEAELGQLQQLAVAKQQAEVQAHQQFLKDEFGKLAELEPELAPDASDPTQGTDKRQGVVKFLIEQGIPKDALPHISAAEMKIAYDAMRYRELKALEAQLKAAPKPKPAPPAKTVAKPSAAPAQTSSQRTAQTAANRFAQTKSVDDAVALLLARQGR